jgi:hypothetical protein
MRSRVIAADEQPGAAQRGRAARGIHNDATLSQCDVLIDSAKSPDAATIILTSAEWLSNFPRISLR